MSREGESLAKFRILSDVDGPRDKWQIEEDRTTVEGNSLHFDFRQRLGVGSTAMSGWFFGNRLEFMFPLTPAVLSEYPPVNADDF